MQKKLNVHTMVLMALMTSLIYGATMLIRIPTPGGFVHMGDFMIFVSVLILGTKKGAVVSGLGMFLVNILGGHILWAPFTLVIKSTMAIIAGTIIEKRGDKTRKTHFIAFCTASIFMVIAYFLAGIVMATVLTGAEIGFMGGVLFASRDIIPNIVQVTVAVAIAMPFVNIVSSFKKNNIV